MRSLTLAIFFLIVLGFSFNSYAIGTGGYGISFGDSNINSKTGGMVLLEVENREKHEKFFEITVGDPTSQKNELKKSEHNLSISNYAIKVSPNSTKLIQISYSGKELKESLIYKITVNDITAVLKKGNNINLKINRSFFVRINPNDVLRELSFSIGKCTNGDAEIFAENKGNVHELLNNKSLTIKNKSSKEVSKLANLKFKDTMAVRPGGKSTFNAKLPSCEVELAEVKN